MFGITKRTCDFITDARKRRSLYISLVRSQFEHCSTIWRPTTESEISAFDKLQKKAIKWMHGEPYRHYDNETYMYVYIYVCICVYVYICVYICVYMYMYICICTHIYIYIYTHIYTHIYTYIHTHIHTYNIYVYKHINVLTLCNIIKKILKYLKIRYTHKIVITIYTTPLKQIKSSKSHVRNILLHNLKFKTHILYVCVSVCIHVYVYMYDVYYNMCIVYV